MGDHAQAFHLVKVFLDLQTQGNGAFPGGMYHRMGIMTESDLVYARKPANAHELIWELLDQVISGPDGLGCFRGCSRLGCSHCCGNMCRTWGFCARLCSCNGTIHLHKLLAFHLRVDPGWQDQGCLQHTNMSLPCGV